MYDVFVFFVGPSIILLLEFFICFFWGLIDVVY